MCILQHDLQTCKYEIHSIFMTKLVTKDSPESKCSTAILQYAKLQVIYIYIYILIHYWGCYQEIVIATQQKLWFCILNLFSHLKQGREHMKCINCTGTIRVTHELVDMTTPGFFCIITCCWLKCSKDGGKKGWGRRGGISINIPKTERENRKRWWKENTKKVAHKICYSREIKLQNQLQLLTKNIHEFSNYFWRMTRCWLQWDKPPNQIPYLQAIIIYLPPSQNIWIVSLYHHFTEEGWNFTG